MVSRVLTLQELRRSGGYSWEISISDSLTGAIKLCEGDMLSSDSMEVADDDLQSKILYKTHWKQRKPASDGP